MTVSYDYSVMYASMFVILRKMNCNQCLSSFFVSCMYNVFSTDLIDKTLESAIFQHVEEDRRTNSAIVVSCLEDDE